MQQVDIRFIGPENSGYSNKIRYSTIEECYEYCKDKRILGEDIETTYRYTKNTYKNEDIYQPGLDPYLSLIVMLQIGDKERVYVIDTRTTDIDKLLPLWEDKERIWVIHNAKFEAKHLLHNYGILHYTIWDCMLVDQNLYNGLGKSGKNKDGYRFSLEALANRYLGVKPLEKQKELFTQDEEEDPDTVYIDKSIRMGFLTIGDKPFTEAQILYGADDIVYPLQIRNYQLKGTGAYNPTEVHKLENEFCLVLADIELKGMTFSKEQWLNNYEKNLVIYHSRLGKLNQYVERHFPKFCDIPDLFNIGSGKCIIKWGSSDQVIELFKEIGCCPKEKSKQTKKVEYTVGAKALLKLLDSSYKELYEKNKETDIVQQKDLILNYLLMKTSEQACTTFGKDWLKYIHPVTDRIHSSYRQILNTGRMSSNKPNVQNIPADKGYRSAFVAPMGYKLINADYSSQESRILAELSGDKAMISFFNDGHPVHGSDYHSFTATKMFSLMRGEPGLVVSKATHPEERNTAKNISFKIAYGGSAFTLKDDFGVEEEVAKEFIDSYMKAFPALDKYFKDGRENAISKGYIDMVPDRRYWDPMFRHMNSLADKAWSYYPSDYNKMNPGKKKQIKDQVNKEHPELKQIWSEYFSLKGSLERYSQNYPIQSLAGSQTKLAGIIFRRYQIQHTVRDKLYLTNLVHDEALCEAEEGYAEECKTTIEQAMIEGGNTYCSKVKMGAVGVITDYWNH